MEKYTAISTVFDIQNLHEKLDLLKTRYEHVCEGLEDKTTSKEIQSIRRLERDFLFSDIRRLEKTLAKAEAPKESLLKSFLHIRQRPA